MTEAFRGLVDSVRAPDAGDGFPAIGDASDAAVARRKAIAAEAGAQISFDPRGRNPKQSFRVVACRLLGDPTDRVALDYIPLGARFREKGDTFGKSALSRIFCQFGDALPEETREGILEEVTTYEGWLSGGTENHIAMRRTAGYLFGEAFPDADFAHGLKGADLASLCLDYAKAYGRQLYQSSMVEFLSPIYHACHTAAWLNLWEFAKDPAARLCARAILDWMFADLAANTHHGIIIPPAARAKGLMTDSYQLSTLRSNSQWTAWLYWGAGNVDESVEALAGVDTWKQSPLSLHAVSDYVPDPVIRNLGAKAGVRPYRLLQARANREMIEPSAFNPYGLPPRPGRNAPNARYVTRSVYVNEDYAIGAGARVADIDEPTVRHAHTFGIVWKDRSPRNWLFCVHPYWYVNRPDDATGKPLGVEDWSGTSPFLQAVHWENAAVLLLDLPASDPYHGQAVGSNPKWISHRPSALTRRFHVYVPETVEEDRQARAGTFLRFGEVYVGLRSIGGEWWWDACGRDGYRRLAIEGDTIGAAVEVGAAGEYGAFDDFIRRVSEADLNTQELARGKRVHYRSTRGHGLEIRHNPSDWRPHASVNGATLEYDEWPICESPYLACRDGVMDVNDGRDGFRVDWRGDLPEYERYTI